MNDLDGLSKFFQFKVLLLININYKLKKIYKKGKKEFLSHEGIENIFFTISTKQCQLYKIKKKMK